MTSESEDKPTIAIRREELMGLVARTVPERQTGISPLAIFAVVAMLLGLFVAIVW